MAGATKISIRTVAALAAVGVGFGATRVNLKRLLLNAVTGPGSVSRIITLVVVLANLKNLPFVWHLRVLVAIFKHMEFGTYKFSPTGNGPSALFQPVITTSRSPLAECDYNLHKSNSTYFTDLDVTRSNIVCCLLRDGIKKLNTTPQVVIGPDGVPAKGRWGMMLGSVQCTFKKEVAPYEPYEMWSRILCWDRKWIYVVSHFVKRGAVTPAGYTVSAPSSLLGSLFGRTKGAEKTAAKKELSTQHMTGNGHALEPKIPHKAIFASALSRYVMKLGRLTVHPEVVMEASGLLPPRPGGWNTMSGPKSAHEPPANGHAVAPTENLDVIGAVDAIADAAGIETIASNEDITSSSSDDSWDWRRIEAENAKGMKLARHLAALDGLHDTFTGEEGPALGFFRDVL